MPNGSGLSLIRQIRSQDQTWQPRIVMLTANALEESRQEALAAGADDFLSKPYEEDELYSIVEKQFAIRFTRQLIRNVPASPSVAGGISAADLLGLPPETRAQLAHAALSLNPQKIADALHYLAQAHPELAQGLAEFSDPSRYQRLWQVLGILDREE